MLDAREDVEVGEGPKHEDGDYRLDGRKDGVGRQRPEDSTHFGGECGGKEVCRRSASATQ